MSDHQDILSGVANIVRADDRYIARQDVKRARDDFRYLVTSMGPGYGVSNNLDYLAVEKNYTKIADVFAVPLDTKSGVVRFPANSFDAKPDAQNALDANAVKTNMYLAVVCYTDGKPVDALMFNKSNFSFANPLRWFSFLIPGKNMFKYSGRSKEYVLRIKNIKSPTIQKNTFGVVIAALSNSSAL